MTMETTDSALQNLGDALQKTQSADYNVRTEAERWLETAQQQRGFVVVALKFVQTATAPNHLRVACAILLKNTISKRWYDEDNAANPLHLVGEDDRVFLRTHVVRCMLETPTSVQRQLSEALSVIAQYDFPKSWPSLLPELIAHISSPDYNKVVGVLNTAKTIFARYRFASKSEELWQEIKYVLVNFAGPLLESFQRVCTDLTSNPTSDLYLDAARLVAHVYLSLSSQDIPEQFEDALKEWMPRFIAILKLPRAPISADDLQLHREDPHDPPRMLDRLQSVVCRIATIYADKYEEEFRPFVPNFVGCVWELLTSLGELSRHDPVITQGLKFMTSVVSKPWHKELFSSEERLRGICERIVIPNIRLRASDLELFTVNGAEYVRRDMEGSDADTRRRLTCDLVRALTVYFEAEISSILFGYIDVLLKEYASNPLEQWISKDAALYVVLALAVQGQTASQGATRVNQHINVLDFFGSHVLPDLQNPAVQDLPVLKADAIKFVSTFRGLLPVDACEALLPLLGNFLASEEFVVHTYAAAALERLLALRDANRQLVIGQERLRPHLGALLTGLFKALQQGDLGENDYVMRAIMRVCIVAKADAIAFVAVLVQSLTAILAQVQANLRNPMFNHYLFETIAVLIRNICGVDKAQLASFESILMPPFEAMLGSEQAAEFGPYIFQILAQLLSLHECVPPVYAQLFPTLLVPAMWEQSGSAHALSALIRCFLSKSSFAASQADRLPAVLGVFQKLLSSRVNDRHGMSLFRTILRFCPWDSLAPFFPQVLNLLLQRASTSMTPQFGRELAAVFAEIVCCRGADCLVEELEKLQAGLASNVLQQVWLAHVTKVVGKRDRRVVEIALASVVSKSSKMLAPPFAAVWGAALQTLLEMLAGEGVDSAGAPEDDSDAMLDRLQEQGGYSNVFVKLACAQELAADDFPSVDPAQVLVLGLVELGKANPGRIPSLVQQAITAKQAEVLQQLLVKANVALV